MTAQHRTSLDWAEAGQAASIDALVLRFGAVLNGLHERVVDGDCEWFIVDHTARLVDCSSDSSAATNALGTPLSNLAGGVLASVVDEAWRQVLVGRVQVIWPWEGGRARAALRSIELHPIRDILADDAPVVGALVVVVDHQSATQAHAAAA
jgi:hypothetical protein